MAWAAMMRAARWFRESTAGQWDNFGPDAQREQQDRAIGKYGLVDAGREWSVASSGWTSDVALTEMPMLAVVTTSVPAMWNGAASACWMRSAARRISSSRIASAPRTARARARYSSGITSSASPKKRSTILPAPARIWPPTAACSASPKGGTSHADRRQK